MKTALKFGLIALATTVSLPAMAFTHEGMTPAVLAYGMAAVYAEDCGSFTPEVAAAADAAMENTGMPNMFSGANGSSRQRNTTEKLQ